MVTLEYFNEKMEAIDEKFDELAAMIARGFAETALKSDLHAVEERLSVIEENYTTKDDLRAFGKNVDIMLDKHIGIFRKDYDDLAGRTKNLEKAVFATS